jgi:NADPH:quinone reductase-like Zn-dependent oxidoreductase
VKALVIDSAFGIDNLRVIDRQDPAPGPGEVRLRVRAVSLNYRDLGTVRGVNYPDIDLPRIPCSDGAGEIDQTGPGVTTAAVGDRVTGLFMPAWIDGPFTPGKAASSQGGLADGMAAEFRVLPEEAVVPIPDHLSFEQAATLPCAALTAWNSLFENRPLEHGQTVVIRGTGGVALFALQFALEAGARVLATTGSADKAQTLRDLGAADVYIGRDEGWADWARELTRGIGADVIVDSIGGASLNQSLAAVRMGGYIALMGVLDGIEGTIRTVHILRKNVHLQGIYVGSREMTGRMNSFLAAHRIEPRISHTFPLEQAQQAFRTMENHEHFGKIVVRL